MIILIIGRYVLKLKLYRLHILWKITQFYLLISSCGYRKVRLVFARTLEPRGFSSPHQKIFLKFIFLNLNPKIFYTTDKINLSVKISTTTLIIYWAKLIYFQSKFSYFFYSFHTSYSKPI